ncbi:hypothetical protein FSP39_002668 [Pinctada imbricata]|uniref:Uncharacterized protein n=1 Tax=Pinctada imbricata TaxID=66713 RepID=A0AA89BR50_PINIB|nr:hypothetical protein FSP39_002668 [Pinctada imbricata]
MGKYKLTYFNARGFAEVARLILKVNDVEFEDVRIEREQWPEMKPNTPQGKLPMLEIDGKKICQSSAIWRRLAREFDMYGKDNDEATAIDTVLGSVDDLWPSMRQMAFGETEEIKNTAQKKVEEEVIPSFMNYLKGVLQENAHPFLVGDKLSLADLAFFTASEQIAVKFPDFMSKYPEVAKHRDRIAEIPKIKDWLSKRPVTEF